MTVRKKATTASRKRRGRQSELDVGAWLADRYGARAVTVVAANVPGVDVRLELPAITCALEVKARRNLVLGQALAQASRNARPGELPAVIVRLDGSGPTTIPSWPVILELSTLLRLLDSLSTMPQTNRPDFNQLDP